MADKRFPPSPKRIQDARKEGKIIKSRLVSVALQWWVMLILAPTTVAWVSGETLLHYQHPSDSPQVAFVAALWVCGKMLGLVFVVTALVTFSIAWLQTRILFVPSLLVPKLTRLSPGSFPQKVRDGSLDIAVGFGRCFLLVCFVAPLWLELLSVAASSLLSTEADASRALGNVLKSGLARGAFSISLLAALGCGVARWRFLRQHGMSLEEVREEHKQDEGDPHIRSARRHEHEMLVMGEIEKRVKSAKVIVVRKIPQQ